MPFSVRVFSATAVKQYPSNEK